MASLTATERREYDRLRSKGHEAKGAWLSATRDKGGPDYPTEDGATFDREGFQLRLTFKRDHLTPEDTGVGSFVGEKTDGTLDRKHHGYHVGRDEHPFFLPECTEQQHIDMGSPREEARRYVLQDLERAEAFESEWWYQGIIVKASREGIELGEGSLWGVETDCGLRHLRSVVEEMTEEAITEARDALGRLCPHCKETGETDDDA